MGFSTGVFTVFLAIVFAAIEVESEGKYGWAERMPTWYRTTGTAARVYGFFMQKKPLTGYHAWMFFLPILVFHFPFFFGTTWSMALEVRAWILYFAWTPLWDYHWFILNPHFGVRNFSRKSVWWHAESDWVLDVMPADYLYGWCFALVLAWFSDDVPWTLELLGTYVAGTIVLILLAPQYHRFSAHMRRHDDRKLARIFHADQAQIPLDKEKNRA